MSLNIKYGSLSFDVPGTKTMDFNFLNKINEYDAALKGVTTRFDKGDHHVENLGVEITDVTINDDRTTVTVTVSFNLKDDSGNKGQCDVDFVVFADIGGKALRAL